MTKYPYIPSMKPLRKFLQDMQTLGTPPKINVPALNQMGIKTSNASYIPPILKFIGFVDDSGVPSEDYKNFKKREMTKSVMASSLKRAYADLFQLYPDAQLRDFAALRDFFVGTTDAGESAVKFTVETFKTLSEFANLGDSLPRDTTPTAPPGTSTPSERTNQKTVQGESKLVINLNIQLELPATQDATIYDKIFESLKRNLLSSD